MDSGGSVERATTSAQRLSDIVLPGLAGRIEGAAMGTGWVWVTSYLLWFFGVSYWRNRVFGIVRQARNASGDCIFLCELGPPEYAMTGPDGREMSNRWDEALLIKTWVRQIWDELGGDD